jgi:Fe-S-cluster containining protein
VWKKHPARAELLALYRKVDTLMSTFSCPGSGDCCHFARTGREPYPTAVELAEVADAARAVVSPKTKSQSLRLVDAERACPLLGDDGRCRIYASRPFGCRTYFCERVEGPGKLPRDEIREIGRRIADLSARAFPRDPGPRALTKALT